MTTQYTEKLRNEIKFMVDVVGFNFLNCSWLDQLSYKSKATLSEYYHDAKTLGKRDIAIMLYNHQDSKLWDIIMK